MPIFDVYQINEIHLAKVRTQRANYVMSDWTPEGDEPNPSGLSFKEWKRYVRKVLGEGPSYHSTTIQHVCDPE